MRIRIRKKGMYADGETKYLLEKVEKNKVLVARTLPKAKLLWDMVCPDNPKKTSPVPTKEEIDKRVQEFGQDLLSEPSREEIERTLKEVGL